MACIEPQQTQTCRLRTRSAPHERERVIAIDIDNRLAQLSSVADVRLPATARDKLLAYVDLLAKWNRTYNLTAIRERERMITHHVLDSLAVLPHLRELAGG